MNSKFLKAIEQNQSSSNRITKIYSIVNNNFDLMGVVQWYGPWRKYAYFPSANILLDQTCMEDIKNFLVKLMDDRKNPKSGSTTIEKRINIRTE